MMSWSTPNSQLPTPKTARVAFSNAVGIGQLALGIGSWALGVGALRTSAEIRRWR